MRNTKSAFTLVELIVVITILAILGTIAFISLQGYSADARNSKRTSDLGNIQSAISLKQVEGVPLMSFVTGTANDLTTIALGGAATTASGTFTYAAGTPAYTVLNVASKDFKDPNDKSYILGATEDRGSAFQISATMEVDSVDTALVNGTFTSRDDTNVTGVTIDGLVATVPDASANFFKKGDIVTTDIGADVITKVSRDGVSLTLTTGGAVTEIALTNVESAGLIGSLADKAIAVTNDSTANLAY